MFVIYNREWNAIEPRAFRTYEAAQAYIKSRGWTDCIIGTILEVVQ